MNLATLSKKETKTFNKLRSLTDAKESAMLAFVLGLHNQIAEKITKALNIKEGQEMTTEQRQDFDRVICLLHRDFENLAPRWPAKKARKVRKEVEEKPAEFAQVP